MTRLLSAAFAALLFAVCAGLAAAGGNSTVSGTFTCTDAVSRSGTWAFDGRGHVHVTYSDGTGGEGTYRVNDKTAVPAEGFGGMMHIDAPGTQLDGFLAFSNGGFSLAGLNGSEFTCVPKPSSN